MWHAASNAVLAQRRTLSSAVAVVALPWLLSSSFTTSNVAPFFAA
jgi:hypothetical protein